MRRLIKHIALFFVLILVSCKETDWTETYKKDSKEPFGTYILREELENLFPNSDITTLKQNVYDELMYVEEDNKNIKANYICIKSEDTRFNQDEIEKLIEFVAKGNDAFLSLTYFSETLKKALHFDTSLTLYEKTNGNLYLKNSKLNPNKYYYDRNLRCRYFSKFDTKNTIVLGMQDIKNIDTPKPNFLKIYCGKGAFYLHLSPIAFTNYYLLKKNNATYVSNVFSYMKDNEKIWWDTQKYLSYYGKDDDNESNSILKFFWQHKSLKWSMLLAFWGLIVFMVFNARRKQRVIPEIKKLKNLTVEFTHTIANLYSKDGNPKNLVDKKITYFLQKIRMDYVLDTNNLDDRFIERLSLKSGNNKEFTKKVIDLIINLSKKQVCTEKELLFLNATIETFFDTDKK